MNASALRSVSVSLAAASAPLGRRTRPGLRSSALPAVTPASVACGFLGRQLLRVASPAAKHAARPLHQSAPVLALFSFGGSGRATMEQSPVAAEPDTDSPGEGLEFAAFGAGCFWGVELAFQRVPGVVKTEVGYTQGLTDKPTYEQVCSGQSGHVEAVRVVFDPKEVGYETLLDVLWQRHDPTQKNRQGGDVGTQYRSGIYYYNDEQKAAAEKSMAAHEAKIGRKLATELKPAKKWYAAEKYHQQYLSKGGRFGLGQSAAKGCTDPIRCYG